MRLSEIKPAEVLKTILSELVTGTIYTGDKPTSGLPKEYIDLHINGGIRTPFSKIGMATGYVLVSVNVALLSTGARNTKKEDSILAKFDTLFLNGRVASKDNYTFSVEPNNMVYSGGGIYEGYSTKLINLNFKYYGNR